MFFFFISILNVILLKNINLFCIYEYMFIYLQKIIRL